MSKFESNVKQIPYPQQNVYDMLSDLTNIEKVKDKVPGDKLKDLTLRQGHHIGQCASRWSGKHAHH